MASSTFLRRLVIGIIAINLFVCALTGFWLYHGRIQDQMEAATTTRNLAQILEQYIVGVVGKIDLALLTVVDEHARLAANGAIDARMMNELLAHQLVHLPEVISLRMTDAGGAVKYGPGVAAKVAVNLADRDFFIRARDDAQSGLIVTKPVFARISKQWVMVLARRLNRPDGSFAGVVYANLALEQLSKTFSAIDVGKHGIISLRDAELGLIARHPELGAPGSAIGQKIVSKHLLELIDAGQTSATYTAHAGADGIERTFTFRRLANPRYYIFVGLATEDYLAEWRNSAGKAVTLITLFILTTLVSARLLYRTWQRQMATVEALTREETRFRAMANYTYDWEYWQGPDLEIIYMTPSCERITGYSQKEFMADPGLINSIILPEDRHLMAEHLSDATYQDEATLDFRIVRRDGGICWIAHGCRAVYGADGQFMGRRASNRDISERKLVEEALRKSEEKHKAIIETTDTGYVILDAQGRVTDANREYVRLTGHATLAEILGRNVTEWTAAHDRERNAAEVVNCLEQGGVRGLEMDYVDGQGRLTPIEINATALNDGGSFQIVSLCRDITKRKQAEEALRLLNETLDQRVREEVAKNIDQERLLIQQSRLAAMGEMIGNIAHQWRQPLNALALLLANLKDANDYHELDTPMIEDTAAQGQQLIQQMSTTIDDFRNFFKPNKAKENFRLAETIETTLELIGHSLKSHNIAVRMSGGGSIQVNGYPNEFSQVLLNIISNAKDAMEERKVRDGRIEIVLGQDEKTSWVLIRDNAGGIPGDILPKIFDPYFTTKEKGTGIGLYMSKMIMDHMNGTIEARNREDGAELRLVLPQGTL